MLRNMRTSVVKGVRSARCGPTRHGEPSVSPVRRAALLAVASDRERLRRQHRVAALLVRASRGDARARSPSSAHQAQNHSV